MVSRPKPSTHGVRRWTKTQGHIPRTHTHLTRTWPMGAPITTCRTLSSSSDYGSQSFSMATTSSKKSPADGRWAVYGTSTAVSHGTRPTTLPGTCILPVVPTVRSVPSRGFKELEHRPPTAPLNLTRIRTMAATALNSLLRLRTPSARLFHQRDQRRKLALNAIL